MNKPNEEYYNRLRENAEKRFLDIVELQKKGLVCLDGDFVPSVHYPPITQYPPVSEDFVLKGYSMPEDGMMDVYVHFPFCERHCLYCHYPGKVGPQIEEKKKYVSYLKREIDMYRKKLGIDRFRPRSVLIGGGTPTYLPVDLLEEFLIYFNEYVDLSKCKQFNYDLDPMSLLGEEGRKKMEIMKKYGVTRLTIGLQSLDDDVLKIMNRNHNAEEAKQSVYAAKEFGFDVNIEFIYGHPGQTFENWVDVINEAIKLPTDEIQLYRLKVLAYGDYQGKIIKNRTDKSKHIPIPDFKETMMMKQAAIDILHENGYNENLRRVFSKQKKIFSHYAYNQCCNLYDQIGFGITAFSSFRDRFCLNTQYFEEYYNKIDEGRLPMNRGYIRSKEQQNRWAIVLPLKNRDIRKKDYKKVTGTDIDNIFKNKKELLIREGLITEDERTIKLTDLGKFIADEVVEQFNSVEYIPFPRDNYAEGILNPYNNNTSEDALEEDVHDETV